MAAAPGRFEVRSLALVVVLVAALAEGAVAAPLSATVEVRNGRPTLLVDGAPEYPMLYALTDVPGGRFSWEDVPARNVREFARTVGVRLFQLDLAMEHVLLEDGAVDLAVARRQIRGVLDARADAGVVFRLHVRPPRWWLARHPEELTVFLDAATQPEHVAGHNRFIEDDLKAVPRVSLASSRWLREMGDVVARFCGTSPGRRKGTPSSASRWPPASTASGTTGASPTTRWTAGPR